ncbi:MAG: Hsp20/alpha crystallin family protein [Phycisphaerae bacterium]
MLLRRVSPLGALGEFGREMDRVFCDLIGEDGQSLNRSIPTLNFWEDGDRFFVEAEVPGLKMEDLNVQVLGNTLTIEGQWKTAEDENAHYYRRERMSGEFTRTLTLPVDIDMGQVEAALKDGVLRVTLPKAEVAKARKINVKALE